MPLSFLHINQASTFKNQKLSQNKIFNKDYLKAHGLLDIMLGA